MRIRFINADLNDKVILINNIRYFSGDIICLPDNLALGFINDMVAEAYTYSIPDVEISKLHKELIETSDFNRKVEILIYSYLNSIQSAILEDGTQLNFKLVPQTPDEWYYYNYKVIEYYRNNFPSCSFDSLKSVFKKKLSNSLDKTKLINFELDWIKKNVDNRVNKELSYWYYAAYCGDIPKENNKEAYKLFLSNHIKFGIKVFLQGIAFAEYENFLLTETTNDNDKKSNTKLFSEYLLSDERDKLAERLKLEFNTEKGKRIRLMIEVLIQLRLLVIPYRMNKAFHRAIKKYFNSDIGSYQSIFDCKVDYIRENDDIKKIKSKVDFIIRNLK